MADTGYRGRPQRGERADRQINAGHSRGLDAALSDTEAKIRKLKTERIISNTSIRMVVSNDGIFVVIAKR